MSLNQVPNHFFEVNLFEIKFESTVIFSTFPLLIFLMLKYFRDKAFQDFCIRGCKLLSFVTYVCRVVRNSQVLLQNIDKYDWLQGPWNKDIR